MRSIDVKMIQFVVAVFSVTASDTAHDDHILTTMILETDNNNNNNNNKLYLHDYNKVLQYCKSHLKFNYKFLN